MLFIYRSNHLEELLGRLSGILAIPQARVMTPETIIVQSQGMARWLSINLADRLGISANLDCAFPATFIWRLLREGATDLDLAPYEPDSMLWAIMELLEVQKNDPNFDEVATYLDNDPADLRRYQLATRLATLFDQYMAYRPDWFRRWPDEISQHWQADLWRILSARYGNSHRAALQDRLLTTLLAQQLSGQQEVRGKLKNIERLSIFGIPALPPSQFEVFRHIAELIDVHLFLLAPCREFWTDFVGAKEMVRARLASGGMDPEADLHFEEGCPLLVSMGNLGREFQILMQDSVADCQEDDFFIESGQESALAILQDDILNGRNPKNTAPLVPSDQDHSLMIHVSHSPMREVEILYDQLLNLLEDPELEPSDILVMTPDISLYAPLVDAVFTNAQDVNIPFTITDGPIGGAVVLGFIDLLGLDERGGASTVMSLLQYEPLRSRFTIGASDLDILEHWVRESGIKWGLHDTSHVRPSSWLAGIERLLMGYVFGGQQLEQIIGHCPGTPLLVDDILPCDVLEGKDGILLGRFLNFIKALNHLVNTCSPRPLAAWPAFFIQILEDFFVSNDDNLPQIKLIREHLIALGQAAAASGSRADISFEVVKAHIKEQLATSSKGSGDFLSGRVAFCQMAPMRSIPFSVICLLGMNDHAFPRHEKPLSFDLSVSPRRLGDRSRRADDRYLFMETIISARQHLYISYTGLSDQDSRQLPPSVLVSELLDHLSHRLGMTSKETALRFVVWHPLQPFSKRYFANNLFSYCRRNRKMAEQLSINQQWGGFFTGFKGRQNETCTIVHLDDFINFFVHPVRFFLRHRFGIYLDDYYNELIDREPFSLGGLARYSMTNQILQTNLTNHQLADDTCLAEQQRGQLPAGEMGKFYFEQSQKAADQMTDQLADFTSCTVLAPVTFDLDLSFTLSGQLDNLCTTGQYLYRPVSIASMKYKDYVQIWIRHLLISALRPNLGIDTIFVGLNGSKTYSPLAANKALQELQDLARVFRVGQHGPLPLYPKSSLTYAKSKWGGRQKLTHTAALERAQGVWSNKSYYEPPENSDPYLAAAFGYSMDIPDKPLQDIDDSFDFAQLAELLLAEVISK